MTPKAHKLSAHTPATVRQSLYVPPLPLLLLLFLCCASVCAAQHDSGVQSTGVVRELPRKGVSGVQAYTVATQEPNGNEEWELIRIVASTKDLENSSRYCTKVGSTISTFYDSSYTCRVWGVISNEAISTLRENIIPAAIKLHRDRLFVRPLRGKWKVPDFENNNLCNFVTVPDEHRRGDGVDADMVLYVAAQPSLLVGFTCAVEESSGRPIAGTVNYDPTLRGGLRHNVRRTAHAIAGALGFNVPAMERAKILSNVTFQEGQRVVVNATLTLEKAQQHYNCPSLQGMELAYDYSGNLMASWPKRFAKDELMAETDSYPFGAGYYTALTMATFESLGYYRANWGMEEPMGWGHKKGCEFFEGRCMEGTIVRYPEYFCNETVSRCTSDRYGYGTCYMPASFVGVTLTEDICRVTESYILRKGELIDSCSDITAGTDALPGSLMGPDSWCLDGDGLQVQEAEAIESVNGVCAQVLCDEVKRTVSVKYKNSTEDKWHDCPEDKSIEVKSSAFPHGGRIKCPKYTEVCTVASNGSSLIPLVVKRPTTASASTGTQIGDAGDNHPSRTSEITPTDVSAGGASAVEEDNAGITAEETQTGSSAGAPSAVEEDNAGITAEETQTGSSAGAPSAGGEDNERITAEETQTGSSADGASAGEDDNARTTSPSAPSDIVAQNTIDILQNGTKVGIQFGQDGALSAVCSLPIVLLAMVLALVLPC